jgi:hypothetical protein
MVTFTCEVDERRPEEPRSTAKALKVSRFAGAACPDTVKARTPRIAAMLRGGFMVFLLP